MLPSGTVSKFHAYIQERAGAYRVTDAGSQNGTQVNDVKVEAHQHHMLESGQTLGLGGVHLRFFLNSDFFEVVQQLNLQEKSLDSWVEAAITDGKLKKVEAGYASGQFFMMIHQ